MLKKVIGIISYLPDDKIIRVERFKKLCSLIASCNRLLNLPIVIIAQNWKNIKLHTANLTIFNYEDKLGIVGARKELRKKFLESDYDYLIMLDDDCVLYGTSGKEYLEQIDENPDCFIEFWLTLLKLFAISKSLFSQVDYDDINPEDGEGFEDRIFVNKLRKLFPDKKREFKNTKIGQASISTKDPLSTWYNHQDLKDMLRKTTDFIDKI